MLGSYSEVIERASGARRTLGWKAWFLLGIVLGGLFFGLSADDLRTGAGYGWLEQALGNDPVATGAVLAGGGVLIGLGAKTAGGCTSGTGSAAALSRRAPPRSFWAPSSGSLSPGAG